MHRGPVDRKAGIRLKGVYEDIKLLLQPKRLYLPRQARRYARKTEKEIGLLPHLVPAGCTAIDGGANKGVYSWWLSKLCRRVLAFEPNPRMYAYMSRAVPSNVEPKRLALAGAEAVRTFNLPTTSGKKHHTRGSLYEVAAGSRTDSFEVQAISIDSLGLDELGFIKLDVEGAELECLRGATVTLERCRPVVMCEVTGVGGSSPAELFAFLIGLGYEVFALADARMQYHGRNPEHIPSERNCVFLPNQLRQPG